MNIKKSFAVASLFVVAAFSANSALACGDIEDLFNDCKGTGGGVGAKIAGAVLPPQAGPLIRQVDRQFGPQIAAAAETAATVYIPGAGPAIAANKVLRNIPQGGGFPAPGGVPQAGGYPQGGGYPQAGGYPQGGGYPQAGGYPQGGGYPQAGGYPQGGGYPQAGGYPQGGSYPQAGGYPQGGGYPQVGYQCITEAATFVGGPPLPIGTGCVGQLPNGMYVNGRIG